MCLIDPEYQQRFEKGEAPLTRECQCTGCGAEVWLDVFKNDPLVCPECGAGGVRVVSTHYPGERH